MFFKCLDMGMLNSNCYIIGDKGEAAVIDAGVDYTKVEKVLSSNGLALKYIILTHAHIDHILQADVLKDACGGKMIIHEADGEMLKNAALNGSVVFGVRRVILKSDLCVSDGDMLELGGLKLEIIHTPGHSPGSICIRVHTGVASGANDCIFTGDTLFRMSVGRTDLGAGDQTKLVESLEKLMKLDESLVVYPGHGPSTDIGYEKRHNPFISMFI